MKIQKLTDILRIYIISPEALTIAISWLILMFYPRPMNILGQEIIDKDSMIQYIALLPVALLIKAFALSKDTLGPLDIPNNKLLYEWKDYWRLKQRVLATLLFCIVASINSIGLWIFKTYVRPELLGFGLISSIALSLTSTVTLYLGYLRLREILQGGS